MAQEAPDQRSASQSVRSLEGQHHDDRLSGGTVSTSVREFVSTTQAVTAPHVWRGWSGCARCDAVDGIRITVGCGGSRAGGRDHDLAGLSGSRTNRRACPPSRRHTCCNFQSSDATPVSGARSLPLPEELSCDLATVVGNLVGNALDAVGNLPDGSPSATWGRMSRRTASTKSSARASPPSRSRPRADASPGSRPPASCASDTEGRDRPPRRPCRLTAHPDQTGVTAVIEVLIVAEQQSRPRRSTQLASEGLVIN